MQSGGEKITEIKTYSCGSCSNNLGLVFKDMPHEKREFPARAILLKHQNDYFIFDTGYSNRVFENGIISKLYAWLNPIHYDDKQDNLANQLAQDGIYLEQIKFIVDWLDAGKLSFDELGEKQKDEVDKYKNKKNN